MMLNELGFAEKAILYQTVKFKTKLIVGNAQVTNGG